jgi:hypothetical protein
MPYPTDLLAYLPERAGQPCYVWQPARVAATRARLAAGDAALLPALAQLVAEAEAALACAPLSVTRKSLLAASGDPHDYFSLGPYWWPNPETADGLPYVRRDGEVNPDAEQTDKPTLRIMAQTVTTLCWAYAFTAREEFAVHAARWLRVWFLDDATRMNPHLDYGQAVPGHCVGRGIGIIDTTAFAMLLLPALALLDGSPSWPEAERAALQDWFHAFLRWLLTSACGQDEAGELNNHGLSYDLQAATFALFVGADELARRLLTDLPQRRIDAQIEPDGRQPRELGRTLSLLYTSMNTALFLQSIEIGRQLGLDLAAYAGADGRSIPRAVAWLLPYHMGLQPWTYTQRVPFAQCRPELGYDAFTLLRQAASVLATPQYAEQAEAVTSLTTEEKQRARARLLYPLS